MKAKEKIPIFELKGKNLYDKKICPDLFDPTDRCKKCKWWREDIAKRIEIIDGEFIERKKGIYLVKIKGCLVLDEACPECLIKPMITSKILLADKNGKPLWAEYQYLIPLSTRKFHCRRCGKKFKHEDVVHVLKGSLLMGGKYDFK